MRSFLSPTPSTVSRYRTAGLTGRSFWHKQSGAVGLFGAAAGSADAEAAQRALLYRSEAFAEDLGPGYADVRYAVNATVAAAAVARR